jgi:hypothetical protein
MLKPAIQTSVNQLQQIFSFRTLQVCHVPSMHVHGLWQLAKRYSAGGDRLVRYQLCLAKGSMKTEKCLTSYILISASPNCSLVDQYGVSFLRISRQNGVRCDGTVTNCESKLPCVVIE